MKTKKTIKREQNQNRQRIILALGLIIVVGCAYLLVRPGPTHTPQAATIPWVSHTITGQQLHFSSPSNWNVADEPSSSAGPPHELVMLYSPDNGGMQITINDGFTQTTGQTKFPIVETQPISLFGYRYYLAYALASTTDSKLQIFAKVVTNPGNINSFPRSPDVAATTSAGTTYTTPYLEVLIDSNNPAATVTAFKNQSSFATALTIVESLQD